MREFLEKRRQLHTQQPISSQHTKTAADDFPRRPYGIQKPYASDAGTHLQHGGRYFHSRPRLLNGRHNQRPAVPDAASLICFGMLFSQRF